MKKVAILQSNYIPWKGYFDIINSVDDFVIYDEVQYTKNDWRNRNLIKTPAGLNWLTIPVKQNSLDQKISETETATDNWNIKHWNSLVANYSKAPFFSHYKELFKELYLGNDLNNLSRINVRFIKTINKELGIVTNIIDSNTLQLEGDKNQRLVEAVKKLNGDIYLSGPAARTYINEAHFNENNIEVKWMDYSGYKEYPQLYPPFEHAVSIADLLFNCGPESRNYLKPADNCQ